MVTEIDLARAAAFIDGEGSISVYRGQKKEQRPRYSLQVQVGNTSERLVRWFESNFGGSVNGPYTKAGGNRPYWIWSLGGSDKAAEFIASVRLYLLIKEPQAWLALEFREQCAGWDSQAHAGQKAFLARTPEYLALQEGFYLAMINLNAGTAGL